MKKLIEKIQEAGYTISTDQNVKARIVSISKVKKEVKQIMLPIYSDDILVGGLIYICGPKSTYTYSLIQKGDRIIAEFIENGEHQNIVFSKEGDVITSSTEISSSEASIMLDISCEEICNVICAGGVAGILSKCVKTCIRFGPGTAWCTALCTIIGGLGCLVGCDVICSHM